MNYQDLESQLIEDPQLNTREFHPSDEQIEQLLPIMKMWMDKNPSLSQEFKAKQSGSIQNESDKKKTERLEHFKQDFFQSDKNGDGCLNRLEYKHFLS